MQERELNVRLTIFLLHLSNDIQLVAVQVQIDLSAYKKEKRKLFANSYQEQLKLMELVFWLQQDMLTYIHTTELINIYSLICTYKAVVGSGNTWPTKPKLSKNKT